MNWIKNIYKPKQYSRNISTLDHCIDTIRKHDYENFICTLLLKKDVRTPCIAIRAFNVEVSKLMNDVSNPQIGEMKYKFWEDAIEVLYKKNNHMIHNHPIIRELYRILQTTKLSKRHFLTLINCRRDLWRKNTFQTINEMELYSERSVSTVYYLILESSKITSVHADHAASHLGKAQGLCQLIRSIPQAKQLNFIPVPTNLLWEYGVSEEDVIRGRGSRDMNEIVFRMATISNHHLEKARSLSEKLNKDIKTILLPATIVDNYLQRLIHVDCDIFNPKLHNIHRMWIPKIWWKNLRNTF